MKRKMDAILLLGVRLGKQDEPTEELRARVKAACRAYRDGAADIIVVCGGLLPGHRKTEAEVMAELLKTEGVPAEAILLENRSLNTMENMRFAARLMGGAQGRSVLVVTSDYHVFRAAWTARRVGFRAHGLGAELPHDEAWKELRRKEWAYTLDLTMGWQDAGKRRPDWTKRLFNALFERK